MKLFLAVGDAGFGHLVLDNAYAKLGVRSRAQAVAVLSRDASVG